MGLFFGLLFLFIAVVAIGLTFVPLKFSSRPTLADDPVFSTASTGLEPPIKKEKKKGLWGVIGLITERLALFNKPLTIGPLGRRIAKDLSMAKVAMTPEEFILIKEGLIIVCIWGAITLLAPTPDMFIIILFVAAGAGYYLPELWVKSRRSAIKNAIVRDLPDTVDLLGLCVNAGLDFMMALKYVIDKSAPSVIIDELRSMLQEINVGKPRRDALRDMARKYELPDLSTFTRTLIQADRMGTSVSEALNILSEDMREARFRRGEQMAMKAPLKMLIPLLVFIFPVVGILVAGPVFLDFFQNNPLQNLAK